MSTGKEIAKLESKLNLDRRRLDVDAVQWIRNLQAEAAEIETKKNALIAGELSLLEIGPALAGFSAAITAIAPRGRARLDRLNSERLSMFERYREALVKLEPIIREETNKLKDAAVMSLAETHKIGLAETVERLPEFAAEGEKCLHKLIEMENIDAGIRRNLNIVKMEISTLKSPRFAAELAEARDVSTMIDRAGLRTVWANIQTETKTETATEGNTNG